MTHKQRLFVVASLSGAHGNAGKAALQAGYKPTSAQRIGHRLLKVPDVKAAIEARVKKVALSVDECLDELSQVAKVPVPERVSTGDKISALSLILKAHGALSEKPRSSGINVTIGFFHGNGAGLAPAGASIQVTTSESHGNDSDDSNNARILRPELSASAQLLPGVDVAPGVIEASFTPGETSNEP